MISARRRIDPSRPTLLLLGLTLVAAHTSRSDIIIPVVARADGSVGSRWRSDLKLLNTSGPFLQISVIATPRGQSESPTDTRIGALLPYLSDAVLSDDFVLRAGLPDGVYRLRIPLDHTQGVVVEASTYNLLPDGGELGLAPTVHTESDYYPAGSILVGFLGKVTERTNGFEETGPDGAEIQYRILRAGKVIHTMSVSRGPNMTWQYTAGWDAGLGFDSRPNDVIEATIVSGSARIAHTPVNNVSNQGRWIDFVPSRKVPTVPVILGIDRNNDGVADWVDSDGDGVLDGVFNVGCSDPFAWEGRIITDPPTGPFNYFVSSPPQGLGVDPGTGRIVFAPPCNTAGQVYACVFSISGGTGVTARFRVD